MGKEEILDTLYGEMLDMISCFSICEGNAVPKKKAVTDLEEAVKMR